MLEEFFRDENFCRLLRNTTRREKRSLRNHPEDELAGAFGRADWVRSQLYYTTLSLDLHDRNRRDWTWTALRSSSTRACNLDLDGRQPYVRELWPLDRLLVKLLYLCV